MASDVSRDQWRKTLLAAMANYIDAGSIVAGAVSLALWAKQFGFGDDFVSLLGAMSANAISAGIGALIGGRICDLWGGKKIFPVRPVAVRVWGAGVRVRAGAVDAVVRVLRGGAHGRRGRPRLADADHVGAKPSATRPTARTTPCRRSGSSRPRSRSGRSTCR